MTSRSVLIAPDKFKGTLAALEVANALAGGFVAAGVSVDVCPIADGGEGTLDVLRAVAGESDLVAVSARDALLREVECDLLLLNEGRTAVVEVSAAIGLGRVAESERDPWAASSAGAGDLIAAAVATGATEVLVAIGGTASTDGGAGATEVLGARVAANIKIRVLCDVRAPWEQSAPLFGPQKGADEGMVSRLAQRMDKAAATLPTDPRGIKATGCGGGLAGALWSHYGAELVPGAPFILSRVGFDERMHSARAVVTGEGRIDRQTLMGKAVGEIATRARQAGVPCHAVVGQNALPGFDARLLDIESIREAGTKAELEEAAVGLVSVLAPV